MSNYLLVKPVGGVETVVNIISASAPTAATYLVANGGDYDYVLDESNYSPTPGISDTYDPGNDTFSPPAEFYIEMARADLNAVHAALLQTLLDIEFATDPNVTEAVSRATSDITATMSPNEADLWTAICAYIESRG